MDRSAPGRPLRVLAIDHTAGSAGGEVALLRLLAAIDRGRFVPSVLVLEDGPLVKRLREASVRTAVLDTSRALTEAGRDEVASSLVALLMNVGRTMALVPRVSAAIRGAEADVVVANSLKSAVITAFAAPLAGRRWVWHLHDRIETDYLPRPLVLALRFLAKFGPRLIVANSQATRRTLPGVADERIIVSYPAVPVPDSVGEWRPPESPIFGLLGRIAPTKGQIEFLHAAGAVAAALPGARFEVLGEAMFNDHIFADRVRALPASLGIADAVTFAGWVDDPTDTLRGLTALVHASPVPEPFGQVVVEGMATGVPVIATAAGGVPEIVDPNGEAEPLCSGVSRSPYGLLVPPRDPVALAVAMEWVAHHPLDAAATAARAAAMVRERFDVALSGQIAQTAWSRALD